MSRPCAITRNIPWSSWARACWAVKATAATAGNCWISAVWFSYGVTDNSNLPVDGTEFDAIFNKGNLKVAEAGNYTLSFTINGEVGKFKLKKN